MQRFFRGARISAQKLVPKPISLKAIATQANTMAEKSSNTLHNRPNQLLRPVQSSHKVQTESPSSPKMLLATALAQFVGASPAAHQAVVGR